MPHPVHLCDAGSPHVAHKGPSAPLPFFFAPALSLPVPLPLALLPPLDGGGNVVGSGSVVVLPCTLSSWPSSPLSTGSSAAPEDSLVVRVLVFVGLEEAMMEERPTSSLVLAVATGAARVRIDTS